MTLTAHVHSRSDSRRNHDAVLTAALEVFLGEGVEASLDAVARAADVGVGTIYRHFGHRYGLQRELMLEACRRSTGLARVALAEEAGAHAALVRYSQSVVTGGWAAIVPALQGRVDLDGDEELRGAAHEALVAVAELVDAAHLGQVLPRDVTAGDLGLVLARLGRPLGGRLGDGSTRELMLRHLGIFLRTALHRPV